MECDAPDYNDAGTVRQPAAKLHMTKTLEDRTIRQYKILRRLGEGGMGTVYLARVQKARKGLEPGGKVAVKFLHPHLATNEDILRRFRREAGLGLAIRNPRVMATYDVGSEKVDGNTVHFLVMEYLPGQTLRQLLDDEGPQPEPRVVSIGRQICEGLAEIHSRGMVHRDIKPSNVFLDSDGEAKIGDLGLSRLLEPDTEISIPGTFLGSVAYAAPEQLEAEAVGPAADLYSLGVTMYELASGKNPFAGADLESTMNAHANLTARPLGEVAKHVSYFLERFVLALLDKDPESRLQPAERLANILERREQSEWWHQFVRGDVHAAHLLPARQQLKVRRETRVYGRAAELEQLTDVLRTAAVGRSGRAVVLVGEAGVGKSRLIDAALEAAETERFGVRAAVSRFLDLAAPVPYYPLNEALLMALDLKGKPRAARRQTLPKQLREYLPERRAFAEAFAALIDDKDEAALESLPREAIPALYAEAFRTISIKTPLIVVLEELQWADRGSLRALDLMVGSIGAFPLALVLTTRPETVAADPEQLPPAAFIDSLRDIPEAASIHLDRLDRDAVLQIVRDLGVPTEAASALATRLHTASEGNPSFLFELIDDLQRRDDLRDVTREELKALPIPSSIVDLFRSRLADLDPEARTFLDFASVFGPRFKLEPVIEGLELDLVTAFEIVGRLSDRYGLIRAFDQAYRFDHHVLRDRVYRELSDKTRRRYHLTVAKILAREIDDPMAPSRAAYEAGIHFSLAESHREAARALLGGARYLVERNLYERAERLAQNAVAHAEILESRGTKLPDDVLFRVYKQHGLVTGHLGKRESEARSLRLASAAAHRLDDDRLIAQTEVLLASFASSTARVMAALQHAEQARSAASRSGDKALLAAAMRVEAGVLRALGETDTEDLLRRAEDLAREAKDKSGLAFGLLLLGQLYLDTDRPMLALETLKEALRVFERLGDERGRGRSFFQLARLYRQLGDLARANKSVDAAVSIASFRSDQLLLARCLYLQGDLAMRVRKYDEAREKLEKAAAMLEHDDDRAHETYAHVALALLLCAKRFEGRDPDRAIEHAMRAVELAHQRGLARPEAYAYTALAVAYLAKGAPRFAIAVSKKCLRFLESQDAGRKRTAEVLFVHYRCLTALGRKKEAKEYLKRAHELVLARADEIDQPVYRRSFLKNDLFNAAVLRSAKDAG